MDDKTTDSQLLMLTAPTKMTKLEKIGLVVMFLFSFVFFLYLTFPFGVAKEAVTATINRSMPINIRIGSLTPNFPIGLDAYDVEVSKPDSTKSLRISNASVEVGFFSLFIGRLRLDITLEDKSKGALTTIVSLPLIALLTGGDPIPRYVEVKSDKYPVDGVFDFALSMIQFDPSYQQFLASYLEKLSFRGQLNGAIELNLNASDPISSSGYVDLSLANGSFAIEDPSLKIDPQLFRRFIIKAKMENGALKFDSSTGLESQDLSFLANGGISLKQPMPTSQIDVTLSYKMEGSLQRELGGLPFIGGTNGENKFQLSGTLSQIKTVNL